MASRTCGTRDIRTEATSPRAHRWYLVWLALVLIVALGTALGLHQIEIKSLWLDEMVSVQRGSRGLGDLLEALRNRNNAPLYYVLLHPFTLIGTDEFVFRLPSLFIGLMGICACYQLGRLFYGKSVGVLAALLLALSPLHLRYSQEARMYSLFEMLSTLSLFFFYKGVVTRRVWPWVGYTLATLLSMYTHYSTALYVAVQGLYLLIATLLAWFARRRGKQVAASYRGQWLGFATCLVIIAIALVPWWSYASPNAQGAGLNQGFVEVFSGTLRCLWAGRETPLSYVIGGLFVMGLAASAWHRQVKKGLLLLVWVLVPIPMTYLLLLITGRFYAIRYLIFVLPVYVLVAARGLTAIGGALADLATRRGGRTSHRASISSAISLTLALLVVVPLDISPLRQYYDLGKPPWREVGAFLDKHAGPDDIVLVYPTAPLINVNYYSHLSQALAPRTRDQVDEAIATHSTIWFVRREQGWQTGVGSMIYDWMNGHGAITLTFNGNRSLRGRDRSIVGTHLDVLVTLYRASWQEDGDALADGLSLISDLEAQWPTALRRGLTIARLYSRYGRGEQAIERYKQALSELPDYLVGVAYSELGVLQQNQGDALQAVESFRQAINIHPERSWYRMQLANALIEAGRPAEAPSEYRFAARLDPELETNAWYHLQIGRAYREAKQIVDAIAAYERVLELDGNNPEATRRLRELR